MGIFKDDKKGIVINELIYWLLALGVFVISVGIIYYLTGSGSEAIAYFKNALRRV